MWRSDRMLRPTYRAHTTGADRRLAAGVLGWWPSFLEKGLLEVTILLEKQAL